MRGRRATLRMHVHGIDVVFFLHLVWLVHAHAHITCSRPPIEHRQEAGNQSLVCVRLKQTGLVGMVAHTRQAAAPLDFAK